MITRGDILPDGQAEGPTRRTSFDSYGSSVSDESSESSGHFVEHVGTSTVSYPPVGPPGSYLSPLELPYGHEDLRYAPDFDTILECDERSPRSESAVSFF